MYVTTGYRLVLSIWFVLLQVDKILKVIPRERVTYLYSATMTKKVAKLQRASLHNPVKVEVSTKYQTVEKLQQSYLFIPSKYKVCVCVCGNSLAVLLLLNWLLPLQDCYLVSVLNELAGNSFMVFCGTCNNTQRYKTLFVYALLDMWHVFLPFFPLGLLCCFVTLV